MKGPEIYVCGAGRVTSEGCKGRRKREGRGGFYSKGKVTEEEEDGENSML